MAFTDHAVCMYIESRYMQLSNVSHSNPNERQAIFNHYYQVDNGSYDFFLMN